MFKVNDRGGQGISIKDKVSYQEEDSMGAFTMQAGFVINIPEESLVQIQPVEGGAPILKPAKDVVILESLIQDIRSLSTSEEFRAYIGKIEERYAASVKAPKGRAQKAKPKPVAVTLNLNL